jgi:hypothetical protein
MTSKEKANELFGKYYSRIEHTLSEEHSPHERFICKQCALVAVDEIINNLVYSPTDYGASITFWQQVKKEIEKL